MMTTAMSDHLRRPSTRVVFRQRQIAITLCAASLDNKETTKPITLSKPVFCLRKILCTRIWFCVKVIHSSPSRVRIARRAPKHVENLSQLFHGPPFIVWCVYIPNQSTPSSATYPSTRTLSRISYLCKISSYPVCTPLSTSSQLTYRARKLRKHSGILLRI